MSRRARQAQEELHDLWQLQQVAVREKVELLVENRELRERVREAYWRWRQDPASIQRIAQELGTDVMDLINYFRAYEEVEPVGMPVFKWRPLEEEAATVNPEVMANLNVVKALAANVGQEALARATTYLWLGQQIYPIYLKWCIAQGIPLERALRGDAVRAIKGALERDLYLRSLIPAVQRRVEPQPPPQRPITEVLREQVEALGLTLNYALLLAILGRLARRSRVARLALLRYYLLGGEWA